MSLLKNSPILLDNRVNDAALRVYIYILYFLEDGKTSIDQIRKGTFQGREKCQAALSTLIEFGYISAIQTVDENGRFSNRQIKILK